MKRWHWYAIALLVAVIVGVLLDDLVAAAVVALTGGAAATGARPKQPQGIDLPGEPDVTLETLQTEVEDAAIDQVDYNAGVGPDGHTVADDIEWAADAKRDDL